MSSGDTASVPPVRGGAVPNGATALRPRWSSLPVGVRQAVESHTDVRDDNVLLTDSGAVTVDWNFVAAGPAWFDMVSLLVQAHGDGVDADALLAREPLTRDVDPDLVDGVLALLLGYLTWAAAQDHVETSPYLRAHQAWYRDASRSWLSRRRGWAQG